MLDSNGVRYEECIVGNIIGPHYWGQQKEIRFGTKHFRPGAKVYCTFPYGGMGHENIRVFGKPRGQGRMITVVIEARLVKNFRLQKVYDLKVLAYLDKYPYTYAASQMAEWMLGDLNKGSCEIKEETKNQKIIPELCHLMMIGMVI